jgi:hypothetical protein
MSKFFFSVVYQFQNFSLSQFSGLDSAFTVTAPELKSEPLSFDYRTILSLIRLKNQGPCSSSKEITAITK